LIKRDFEFPNREWLRDFYRSEFSFSGEPIMNSPAGTTTISGHASQSLSSSKAWLGVMLNKAAVKAIALRIVTVGFS
jgi:hypothetical protein